MAANLPPEYYVLEEEYTAAKSREERIRILEAMLSKIPQHKCSQTVRGEIRRKISILRKEIDTEARKRKGAGKKGIKKEGAAQVCLLGLPNTGKSYILNKLCNKNLASTPLPFETTEPEIGMMNYKGVLIQLIEIPSVYRGFYQKRGDLRNMIYTCDALCFVVRDKEEADFIKSEIELGKRPYIIVHSDELEQIPEKLWNILGIIKIFTKTPGKRAESRPVALKKGSTVEDLGREIHKQFIDRFRYAKVIRPNSIIKERQVGLRFVLEDEDIVEFHVK